MQAALDRTLLLMRTDLLDDVSAEELLCALTETSVVLSASEDVLLSHSGQTAFVTAALLLARSGHCVRLDAPNVDIIGNQPPLRRDRLIDGLLEVGADLLPGCSFTTGMSDRSADLVVCIGQHSSKAEAADRIFVTADDWSAQISGGEELAWNGGEWPLGAFAAAALIAGEVFKVSMRRLRDHAKNAPLFDDLYAPARSACVRLAPAETPHATSLDAIDLISGGAIGNSFLYTLLRLPRCSAEIRVMDDDESALSNLNRNALLRRSRIDIPKVEDLASFAVDRIAIKPLVHRYGGEEDPDLADTVIVGVDHIPSRWSAQRSRPTWLGVGATEGFSVQVSHHLPGQACAQCLHPEAAPIDGPIPTVAFVSFWAGLLLAADLIRKTAGTLPSDNEQQVFLPALRPESWNYAHSPINPRAGCPSCAELGVVS